jgi:putative hydrolase of the HAD superfamily
MGLVILDLDNTLIDRAASFERWTAEFVAYHGLDPGERAWLRTQDGDGFVARAAFMTAIRRRYGLDAPLEGLLEEYRARIVALVEVDPGVPALLDRLREAGDRVAIATNGQTAQQVAKLRTTGLDQHVDAYAVSEEAGAKKPDRRLFEVAAARCGARLGDGGWMVGDCAIRDIGGGRAAGLRTVWMRRGRTWDPAEPEPDGQVDALLDVEPLLTAGR